MPWIDGDIVSRWAKTVRGACQLLRTFRLATELVWWWYAAMHFQTTRSGCLTSRTISFGTRPTVDTACGRCLCLNTDTEIDIGVCEQVGSGAAAGDSIDLYECDGCTTCGWLLAPHSSSITQISYASDASYCIERSVGLQLQPCNSTLYSDQQWYISSVVSTRQVLSGCLTI